MVSPSYWLLTAFLNEIILFSFEQFLSGDVSLKDVIYVVPKTAVVLADFARN